MFFNNPLIFNQTDEKIEGFDYPRPSIWFKLAISSVLAYGLITMIYHVVTGDCR